MNVIGVAGRCGHVAHIGHRSGILREATANDAERQCGCNGSGEKQFSGNTHGATPFCLQFAHAQASCHGQLGKPDPVTLPQHTGFMPS